METYHLILFLRGGSMMASLAASMYFFKFWRATKDRLFVCFGIFFALIVVDLLFLLVTGDKGYYQPLPYIVRLVAFLVIIWGIIEKNRR